MKINIDIHCHRYFASTCTVHDLVAPYTGSSLECVRLGWSWSWYHAARSAISAARAPGSLPPSRSENLRRSLQLHSASTEPAPQTSAVRSHLQSTFWPTSKPAYSCQCGSTDEVQLSIADAYQSQDRCGRSRQHRSPSDPQILWWLALWCRCPHCFCRWVKTVTGTIHLMSEL